MKRRSEDLCGRLNKTALIDNRDVRQRNYALVTITVIGVKDGKETCTCMVERRSVLSILTLMFLQNYIVPFGKWACESQTQRDIRARGRFSLMGI